MVYRGCQFWSFVSVQSRKSMCVCVCVGGWVLMWVYVHTSMHEYRVVEGMFLMFE